ncbi:threonine--tRNA ligase [Candidatus Micrarchaeota archaeon CG10_big_fil_rev_8_21_14_0_10_45_29]|nr:MAG: threonine--tRNA ligase [Candidatus Micrarchaeota archaeon CG10_big_fil_rev_8_21_14_0_10_45_29]
MPKENIILTLPDGKKLEMPKGSTVLEAAAKIGPGLAKAVVAGSLDGKVVDLGRKIEKSAKFVLYKPDSSEGLEVMRHSCAHVMAQAVLRVFPNVKLTIGPVIEDGFYYDFAKKEPFTPENLLKIEKEMQNIIDENQPFERIEVSREKALKLYPDNKYKRELIEELPASEKISVYYNKKTGKSPPHVGEFFFDLCSGPHLPSTGRVGAFKLMKVAGAYWRGSSENDMLQRIYGTCFATKKELDEYLHRLEQAQARDHRKIGKELGLIMFSELAPGMPFLLPKGAIVRDELVQYMRAEQKKLGYLEINSPIVYNNSLWHTSGHWEHYKDNMYFTQIDEQEYALKPMNCPGHMLVFNNSTRSYRDLPLKLAEFGLVHRHELSGVLSGMVRVRAFVQDDAHIFCTPEQVEAQVEEVMELVKKLFLVFGFEYFAELSTRPPKYMGERETWDAAEKSLKSVLEKSGIKYEINEGDGAFYGPKIDFKVKDAIGRVWQLSTIQLDFQMPGRFSCEYEGSDGKKHTPIVIHRAVLGSIERFMGILIEHYAGKFPVWLAPVQVALLPINDEMIEFAKELASKFKEAGIRAEVNEKTETINAKIRDAQMQKIPYMLVVGKKEKESGELQVRQRDGKQFNMRVEEFILAVKKIIEAKKNIE